MPKIRIYAQQFQREQEALKSTQQYQDLGALLLPDGPHPYLGVLTAQNTVLSNQQTLVGLQINRMVAEVNLVEALGGGWDRSQLPTPSQVAQRPSASDYRLQQ